MKYFLLMLVCFICVAKSHGQTGIRSYHGIDIEITKERKPKKIYTKVIKTSAIPGVDSSWIQSFEESLNRSISLKNKVKAGKYMVSVRILVEKDGSIADMRCLNDPGFGMYEQVKAAIIKNFPSGWGPREVREYRKTYATPQVRN